MLHLLKAKSKVQWSAKKRKTYEPLKPGLKVQVPAINQSAQIDSSAQQVKMNIQNVARAADAKNKQRKKDEMDDG